MADSPNDRAVQALADALFDDAGQQGTRRFWLGQAAWFLERLAREGLAVTDLTDEKANALLTGPWDEQRYHDGLAELRRLAGLDGGKEQ